MDTVTRRSHRAAKERAAVTAAERAALGQRRFLGDGRRFLSRLWRRSVNAGVLSPLATAPERSECRMMQAEFDLVFLVYPKPTFRRDVRFG
ncbi:hypothetical protein [Fodinicola acaciae]|uniref:hypothetical protein n=1 Tax=Fodinicola acaciae TaxID=2681555 RepID=UPI0013CF8BEB|nr:hypothetical protein [Fodinicola acaciae]